MNRVFNRFTTPLWTDVKDSGLGIDLDFAEGFGTWIQLRFNTVDFNGVHKSVVNPGVKPKLKTRLKPIVETLLIEC